MSRAVHKSDEMFHYLVDIHDGDWDKALAAYFETGLQAFRMTDQIVNWHFGRFDSIRLLDFASGYGRVTRHLLSKMPPNQLTISDLMPDAVDFQRCIFGIEGIVSTVAPERLELPGKYDLIQAISLFSHLPDKLFRQWLVKLWSHLDPNGALIISVHGCGLQSGGGRGEFVFVPTSENANLDPNAYGTTWVSSTYVSSVLNDALTGFSFKHLPKGLCGYQDVYVIIKDETESFNELRYDSGIEGYIDVVECHPNSRLICSGWAAPFDREEPLIGIEFLLNGSMIADTTSFNRRHDVAAHFGDERLSNSGWDLKIDLPSAVSFSQDVAMIVAKKAESSTILSMGCIYSLMADSARANLRLLSEKSGARS